MDDLTAFLTARYDEKERKALAASPGTWSFDDNEEVSEDIDDWTVAYVRGAMKGADRQEANGHHIADNDPVYVLADIASKRRMIAEHPHVEVPKWEGMELFGCRICSAGYGGEPQGFGWCVTVRLLAQPFAWHPDYRAEWAP